MNGEKTVLHAGGRSAALYRAENPESPLIVLNGVSGDGGAVAAAMRETACPDCHLLAVGDLNWDHDMSPWPAPPLYGKGDPFTGGADEYLRALLEEILPEALSRLGGTPAAVGLAGYSLAGLFALYALTRTDRFDRAASVSGSLWFPDFGEYAKTHAPAGKPKRIYLSLGDREAKTRHPLLKTVQERTEALARFYREAGIPVTYELNPGNHFQNAERRTAKGIAAIL